jgi:hypothetical protein
VVTTPPRAKPTELLPSKQLFANGEMLLNRLPNSEEKPCSSAPRGSFHLPARGGNQRSDQRVVGVVLDAEKVLGLGERDRLAGRWLQEDRSHRACLSFVRRSH